MKVRLLLSSILMICACASESRSAEPPGVSAPPIYLTEGEQRLLILPDLERFSLGNRAIVRAVRPPLPAEDKGEKSALLLKGISPGISDLWVWKSDGRSEVRSIRVVRWDSKAGSALNMKAIAQLQEVEVIHLGKRVLLRGKFDSEREAALIAVLKNTPSTYVIEAEPSDRLLNLKQEKLDRWIKENELTEKIQLTRLGKTLVTRGSLKDESEKSKIEEELKRIYPLTVLELNSLSKRAATVFFQVYLLELKKDEFSSLGVSWPGSKEGGLVVSEFGLTSDLALPLTLQALSGNGTAQLLAHPKLVVRAPGKAELFAGGELPIRLRSQFQSKVSWKPYGLKLLLDVTELSGEWIRLSILAEVSHLMGSDDEGSIPGIQVSRMKTEVDARFSQPLFLSGLLQDNVRRQASGLPLLREIPVLGKLFGSEDFLSEKSELVAILIPSSQPPPAPLQQFGLDFPKGRVPPPRNWIPPAEIEQLKHSRDYPWNAF